MYCHTHATVISEVITLQLISQIVVHKFRRKSNRLEQKMSKLELYLEILKTLENKKPSKLALIRQKTNLDSAFVKQAMSFLEKQNLVEKRNIKNGAVYKSTPRGERITRYFMGQIRGQFGYMISDDVTYTSARYP